MSTAETTGVDSQQSADLEAVILHATEGVPLDPAIRRRVEERADCVIAEILRVHGSIDDETVSQLIRESRDS
jgi:hypothetical protein